jgi:rhodanese-related sulfurtransferase
VDTYRYDEAWELDPTIALSSLYSTAGTPSQCLPSWQLLDLRTSTDFNNSHLPGALNWPLQSHSADTKSPFFDSQILEAQWKELESLFQPNSMHSDARVKDLEHPGRSVMLVCYDGDTSRVATSILRARNIQASSIRGGMRGHEFVNLVISSGNKKDSKVGDSKHSHTTSVHVTEVGVNERLVVEQGGRLTATIV